MAMAQSNWSGKIAASITPSAPHATHSIASAARPWTKGQRGGHNHRRQPDEQGGRLKRKVELARPDAAVVACGARLSDTGTPSGVAGAENVTISSMSFTEPPKR